MKIAIIQMSDLHITSERDYIVENANKLAKAISTIVNECQKVIMVITGDIVDKGKVANYEYAKKFVTTFRETIDEEARVEWEFVMVPGNHDLDFSEQVDFRDLVMEKSLKNGSIEKDSHLQELLKPQVAFWNFYSEIQGTSIKPQVSYKKIVEINDHSNIEFHCYNTALFSTIEEKPQSLLLPESFFLYYTETKGADRQDLVLSVFHHKFGWLSTQGVVNNQRQFSDHVQHTSQILMCGHEHQKAMQSIENLVNRDNVLYLESDSMQQGYNLSYSVLVYSDQERGKILKYEVDIDIIKNDLRLSNGMELSVPHQHKALSFAENYLRDLNNISAPIHHPRKGNMLLEDIYVFPDLEPQDSTSDDKVMFYLDSKDLIDNCTDGTVYILEGDIQCGKSALLKMLSKQCYQRSLYPILLRGSDINNTYVNTLLESAYRKQYDIKGFRYDQYLQLDRKERIVLIDNIDKSSLNNIGKDELWKKLLATFKCVIVTTGQSFDVRNCLKKEEKEYSVVSYYVQPLGHLKRNELIEKWVRLGVDRYTTDENMLIETVKHLYNQIEGVLGKELLPSNPIFLLTLLQNMDSSLEAFYNAPTSYAALYQSLIFAALLRANVPQDKLTGIVTFLSGLSYEMYIKEQDIIRYSTTKEDEIGYSEFYDYYRSKHVFAYTKEQLCNILIDAQIWIKRDENHMVFSYKYLYYYLTAQELADMIIKGQKKEVQKHIEDMCRSLHRVSNSNVLIFFAYLDKSKLLLDEIRFASLLPFEDLTPITLRKDDALYQELSNLVTQLKEDVLKSSVNPYVHRQEELQRQDKEERVIKHVTNKSVANMQEELEHNTDIREYVDSLIVTRIIGQIIKNQRDTLDIDDLLALIKDAYVATFRSVSYLTQMIEHDYQDFVKEFVENGDKYKSINVEELKDRISKLLQGLLLKMSLMSFGNLSLSVGTSGSDVMELYDEVAKQIDSPAADFITFTIKTYYGTMHEADLKAIVKTYQNNPVMMRLINSRVRSYVYQHDLSREKMQAFGSITKMKLVDTPAKQIMQRKA